MCIGITSNILEPTVSVFNTDAKPNLIPTSFIPLAWFDFIRPIHNMFLQSTSESPFQVIGEIILFVQLGDLPCISTLAFWTTLPCSYL